MALSPLRGVDVNNIDERREALMKEIRKHNKRVFNHTARTGRARFMAACIANPWPMDVWHLILDISALGKEHFALSGKTRQSGACLVEQAAQSDSFHETLSRSSRYFSLCKTNSLGFRKSRSTCCQDKRSYQFFVMLTLNLSSVILCLAVGIAEMPYFKLGRAVSSSPLLLPRDVFHVESSCIVCSFWRCTQNDALTTEQREPVYESKPTAS